MAKSALTETSAGAFKRTDSTFRHFIKPGGEFEPEGGRYHLYVSYACPWAHRTLIVRSLKGLQNAIGISVVHPTWKQTRPGKDEHRGWAFAAPDDEPFTNANGFGSFPATDCIPDTINGAKFVRDLYEMTGHDPGKYSVPVLWDKKTKTIVNNESSEIVEMFNSAFNDFAENPALDLFPVDKAAAMADINKWVYHSINNGVYRCGFATAQEPYEEAFNELFAALDRVEAILSESKFLVGDKLSIADIRLWVTLIRFDPVYVVYFKTNKKCIREYPKMSHYVKTIAEMEAIKGTTNMYHIKTHYFTSHERLNHYAVVPVGPSQAWAS